MNIYEYYNPFTGFKKESGRFGLELETEVADISHYKSTLSVNDEEGGYKTNPPSKFWYAKHDNSLRNFGVEFVLKKPHDLVGVKMALDEFSSIFSGVNFIKDAPATSVHVHVNMQELNARQVGNFIVLWSIFENILVEYSGEPRRSNLFTLPMRCAEGNVRRVVQLFRDFEKKDRNALMIEDQNFKYAAMNLAALKRFGTIEIRCFRGESDVVEVFKWIKILDKLYEYAKTNTTPPDIVSKYGADGLDLFYDVFKDSSDDILNKVPDPIPLIERNIFYSAIMSDAIRDWSSIDPVFVHKPKVESGKKRTEAFGGGELVQFFHNTAPQQTPVTWAIIDDIEPNF